MSYLRGIVVEVALIILMVSTQLSSQAKTSLHTSFPEADTLSRLSVVFLMGEDAPQEQYFMLAGRYFTDLLKRKHDRIVRHVRSLAGVICYLNQEAEGKVWDEVFLVMHGNAWSGLSVPLYEGASRVLPRQLLIDVRKEEAPAIDASVVDHHTRINIWGCGVGRNPLVVRALEDLFNASNPPSVKITRAFVMFSPQKNGAVSMQMAAFWPYFFPRGYQPPWSIAAEELRQQYPEEEIPWLKILQSEGVLDSGFVTRSFHVPVVWKVIYANKEDRPYLGTESAKEAWMEQQQGLQTLIRQLEIPKDRYQWTVHKIVETLPDGTLEYAVKAIGMSTVVCVLRTDGQI